jgi:diguanylate cyclase (GGDEF)-like protein
VWLLSRPLAADDQRARFWCRHLRLGIVLSQLAAAVVIAYAWLAHRPAAGPLTLLCLAIMVTTPTLLALPMQTLSRDHRGVLIFYAWSLATTTVITLLAIVDGGASSPLAGLLVLTLTYAAWAYPPMGVGLMGIVMVSAYLVIVLSKDPLTIDDGLPAAVLAVFTVMIAWAARNHWDLADQQRLLAERLATLADTDELTSTLNRRALAARLDKALAEASLDAPVAVCIIDLDGFKEVNDNRGHDAGDAVLKVIADALLTAVRETDSVGRIGGDEFAVLLPGSAPDEAARAAQRLCNAVALVGRPDGVTASVGLAISDLPIPGAALLANADRRMYQAKHAGGNQVHTSLVPSPI